MTQAIACILESFSLSYILSENPLNILLQKWKKIVKGSNNSTSSTILLQI